MIRPDRQRRAGFHLRKWYLDCTSPDGDVFVGYAARLRIGPFPLWYHAVHTVTREGLTSGHRSLLPARLPTRRHGALEWRNRRLGVEGRWEGAFRSRVEVLLDEPDIRVAWCCLLPRADVSVSSRAGRCRGVGYAEELLIAGRPDRLPIRELRWGRFCAESSSVVWIEWVGPHPLRLVLLDGERIRATRAQPDEVAFEGGALRLGEPSVIRDASVGESAFGRSGGRARLMPGRVAEWREEKWLSRGTLTREDGRTSEGWAIHERVTWPRP